ncbi:FKBP-type peptidyl-prolyl cis-trans isomerase [Longimicrobium sp.]|uniref:FKBP-type peptidyl-prolyl cis-trans isomerase n=1 Tax=Longimicrobium sp. TaxID=2029185 RepID=UPI003B3BCAC9
MHRLLPLLFVLLSGACATAAAPPVLPLEAITFAPSLQVDLDSMEQLTTGVYIRDLREGDGPLVRYGRRVAVHYTGYLSDGTQIEQLAPSSPPAQFTVGERAVIRGWEEGIIGMRPGGERQIVIPPSKGYGARQVGRVPPNSTLVFVIRMVWVR